MKRIIIFLTIFMAATTVQLRAQDAAVEERLKQLHGYVQDLQEDKANQRKQIEALSKEIQALREQQSQPNTSYATQEELRKLAERVQEIDRKREADKELILKEIQQLGKAVANPPVVKRPKPVEPSGTGSGTSDKGYEYVVQSGDSLSLIAAAYKDKGVKVTVDQILKANPGLKPEKLKVGQTIFIPSPKE
jgi:nucleoid-associated protein YgaU